MQKEKISSDFERLKRYCKDFISITYLKRIKKEHNEILKLLEARKRLLLSLSDTLLFLNRQGFLNDPEYLEKIEIIKEITELN